MTADESLGSETSVPRETSPSLQDLKQFFGTAFPAVQAFNRMLVEQGELRGLIGPRELDRLWERHLLNSAAVVQFLPETGTIVDLGSGAGLPGVVVAAMRPEAQIILVEPMERRCTWLFEVIAELGLANVEVKRGRAEEFHGAFEADVVTARAVAPLDRLARWSFPLLRRGGSMTVLKGRQAATELPGALKVLRKYGASDVEILQAETIAGLEATTVVRAVRTK